MTRTLGSIALSLLLAAPAGAADWTGKVLRLGVDPTYPPLEYKQPDGRLAGFGIEIGEALCAGCRPAANGSKATGTASSRRCCRARSTPSCRR